MNPSENTSEDAVLTKKGVRDSRLKSPQKSIELPSLNKNNSEKESSPSGDNKALFSKFFGLSRRKNESKSSSDKTTNKKAHDPNSSVEHSLLDAKNKQKNAPDSTFSKDKKDSSSDQNDNKSSDEQKNRGRKIPLCKRVQIFLLSPEHSATFKCVCFFIYLISVFVLLSLYGLVFYTNYNEYLPVYAGSLEYIDENLNVEPIQELRVILSTSTCPSEFETVTLGTYKGTVSGCYCSADSLLMAGSCDRKESCNDLTSTTSQIINIWKGHKFCIKRASTIVKASVCDNNYKSCYSGACVPENITCPITLDDIASLSSINFTGLEKELTFVGSSSISTDMPIAYIEQSLNGISCFDRSLLPLASSIYILEVDQPTGCGLYKQDKNTFEIDNQTEIDLYKENKIMSLIGKLPLYTPVLEQGKVLLVGRKKLSINNTQECLSIDTTVISDAWSVTQNLSSTVSASLGYGFCLHIMAISTCLIAYFYLKSGLEFRKQIFQDNHFQLLYILFAIAELLVYIQMFIKVASYAITVLSKAENIADIGNLKCLLNSQAQTVLDAFGNSSDIVAPISGLAFLLFIVELVCVVLLLIGFIGSKIHVTAENNIEEEEDEDQEI